MTLRSLISGTVNSLRHTNTNIAKPVEPVITSAALTGADATTAAVAFTQPTIGMPATSFTATSTPGSITRTANTSPITFESMALSPNTNYTFALSSVGANGTGPATISGSVATDDSYILTQTFTSSGNFTVPAGATKIAVFAIGGGSGGNGGSGGSTSSSHIGNSAHYGTAGNGGLSAAIAAFKEVAVTPGDIYSVTVGAGGGAGSTGGTTSFGNLVSVAVNTVTGNAGANLNSVTAPTVGNGGSGGGSFNNFEFITNHAGSGGNISNTAISLSQNLTGLGSVTYTGTDGGGGGSGYAAGPGASNIGAGSGGNAGGSGGTGSARGAGGGGGGAPTGGTTSGGSGVGGAVYVYVRY
jgi:hypothetical protein